MLVATKLLVMVLVDQVQGIGFFLEDLQQFQIHNLIRLITVMETKPSPEGTML